MSIIFKLKHEDITRRIALAKLPKWDALAGKLSSVFLIPMTSVGVSYADTDGEEITLNSQEELDDFYKSTYRHGESIRFTVMDLAAAQLSRGAISHEFAFHHHPPSPPSPFSPGFPYFMHPYPELTLSYGMPPPPPPSFPPLNHLQGAPPLSSPPHRQDQLQSNEGINHKPHGSHSHHPHHHHTPSGAFGQHHHAHPTLPSLNITLRGPHGPPHTLSPDFFFSRPHHHPHPGLPSTPHHQSSHSIPCSPHIPGSHSIPPHHAHPSPSSLHEYGIHVTPGDTEKSQE